MSISRSVSAIGLALALIVVLLVSSPVQQGQARRLEQGSRYFPTTGFSVDGDFLAYYEANGDLEVFGYPITERFWHRGIEVQYFQKARFESHPANPDPYKVQLGLIGNELNYSSPSVQSPQFTSTRRMYFPQTGHIVSYAFLDYFQSRGGIDIFGYPISEMHYDEEGRIVQYFQRMKLEWHAENRVSPVQIGDLGEIYVALHKGEFSPEAFGQLVGSLRVDPSAATVTPTMLPVTAIQTFVSVRYSVMGNKGNQEVSVLVKDNTGSPVHNAQVSIRLISSSGDSLGSKSGLLTDKNGFVKVSIPVSGGRPGQEAVVYADVDYNALRGSAEDAFLLWW